MGMPERRRCFDTMLGLPPDRENWRQALGTLIRDPGSAGLRQPAGYMFRDLPEVPEPGSYEEYLLAEMDRWDVEAGLIPVGATEDDLGRHLVRKHPDRLYGSVALDPHDPIGSVGRLRKGVADLGVRAATVFPCGTDPQVGIDDPLMYPLYAACVDLGLPVFVNAGVPGPRVPSWPQEVERLDRVCHDFPELVIVTRHGCEPWTDLAVELMLRWPGLHYSTSAFAPRHYPTDIIEFANTLGAQKVMYGGYFPYGLSLERIARELPLVPLRDEVWPLFLRDNARRVLGLG